MIFYINKEEKYMGVIDFVRQSRPNRWGALRKTLRGCSPPRGADSFATFGPDRVRMVRERGSKVYYTAKPNLEKLSH